MGDAPHDYGNNEMISSPIEKVLASPIYILRKSFLYYAKFQLWKARKSSFAFDFDMDAHVEDKPEWNWLSNYELPWTVERK